MILVTGASGFIGRAICGDLLGKNRQVRGMVRSERGVKVLPHGTEPVLVEDLAVQSSWRSVFSGITEIVHLAAKVPGERPAGLADFLRVNVDGTARLAQAAANAGVRRLVFVSSAKIHGEGRREPYREDDRPAPPGPYAESKRRAEQALLEVAGSTGMETVILRPPVVYGPGVKGNFLRLLQLVKWGVPLPVGGRGTPRSMLFLGNLVDAIHAGLFHPAAAGKIFLAKDGEDLALMSIMRLLAESMGRRSRCISFPVASGKTLRVDDSLIRRTLDWNPPFACDDGLRQTVHWYLQGRR